MAETFYDNIPAVGNEISADIPKIESSLSYVKDKLDNLVAEDHPGGTDDAVINTSYGTSATPPTASTTTEGSIYIQYTA